MWTESWHFIVKMNPSAFLAANFGKDAATIKLKSEIEKVWLSNRIDGTVDCEKDSLNLRSCEVVVLELENHK